MPLFLLQDDLESQSMWHILNLPVEYLGHFGVENVVTCVQPVGNWVGFQTEIEGTRVNPFLNNLNSLIDYVILIPQERLFLFTLLCV